VNELYNEHYTTTYIDAGGFTICEGEVLLLNFAQFTLETFFRSGAPKFTPGVAPMAGPVVLDGIAISLRRRGIHLNHDGEQVINRLLVGCQLTCSNR
jgi:hypothetical protein